MHKGPSPIGAAESCDRRRQYLPASVGKQALQTMKVGRCQTLRRRAFRCQCYITPSVCQRFIRMASVEELKRTIMLVTDASRRLVRGSSRDRFGLSSHIATRSGEVEQSKSCA